MMSSSLTKMSTQPGGAKVLQQHAGKDATKMFKSLHPPGTLQKALPAGSLVGVIDVDDAAKLGGGKDDEEQRIELARASLRNVDTVRTARDRGNKAPRLTLCFLQIVCLDEFEEVAQSILSQMAASYYGTGCRFSLAFREYGHKLMSDALRSGNGADST